MNLSVQKLAHQKQCFVSLHMATLLSATLLFTAVHRCDLCSSRLISVNITPISAGQTFSIYVTLLRQLNWTECCQIYTKTTAAQGPIHREIKCMFCSPVKHLLFVFHLLCRKEIKSGPSTRKHSEPLHTACETKHLVHRGAKKGKLKKSKSELWLWKNTLFSSRHYFLPHCRFPSGVTSDDTRH